MNSSQLALLALLLGALIGAAVSILIVVAFRARDRAVARNSEAVPDGVSDVLAAMDDSAVVVDASGTVRASSASGEAFGMAIGEVLPDDRLRELARSVRAGGGMGSASLTLRRAATPAEPRLVSARATVLSPRLVLLVIRDITERERVEQMRRDFVANTSHELKTPVGAISLLSEAIESAADDPAQVRIFAARLNAEAARLGSLTSRVMNLSRLQSADELAEVRDISIDAVVTSAIEAHGLAADSSGVTLVRGGARGLYVRGDQQILTEAVGNLVANAIAYSPRASSVGIGVKQVHNAVEITVTDRGIGISEEDQQRVFERFYRSDQARSRRTGGTGLGLAIVKHAVQRHGGEVRIWSKVGRGSTFTIQLPIAAAPAPLDNVKDARPKRRAKKAKKASGADAMPAPVSSAPASSAPAQINAEPMNGVTE
ncbi:ATP-binding protein [Microbacterium sp. cx-55]|uniref:sensor histidine kinase n=1 Tax=Microbacterium sp. cx-55 TaxID=2875948 RepID=UPI001CBB0D8D|nr:ATP-binding protein [Microbacterium sp. cx-55]MBZ4488139.1 two-component sensor histidine kinase [Microbacterium sp. cx-55]UGB34451.1 ATP-binding protein [Microbacterium sp. cx-55]